MNSATKILKEFGICEGEAETREERLSDSQSQGKGLCRVGTIPIFSSEFGKFSRIFIFPDCSGEKSIVCFQVLIKYYVSNTRQQIFPSEEMINKKKENIFDICTYVNNTFVI